MDNRELAGELVRLAKALSAAKPGEWTKDKKKAVEAHGKIKQLVKSLKSEMQGLDALATHYISGDALKGMKAIDSAVETLESGLAGLDKFFRESLD